MKEKKVSKIFFVGQKRKEEKKMKGQRFLFLLLVVVMEVPHFNFIFFLGYNFYVHQISFPSLALEFFFSEIVVK